MASSKITTIKTLNTKTKKLGTYQAVSWSRIEANGFAIVVQLQAADSW